MQGRHQKTLLTTRVFGYLCPKTAQAHDLPCIGGPVAYFKRLRSSTYLINGLLDGGSS